jgi:acetylornithine deacetylase
LDVPVEEEIGGNGTLSSLLYDEHFDEAICLEPTELRVFRGHRGCLTFKVSITGRSVHMGGGETGIDAIASAIDLIMRLRVLEQELLLEAKNDPAFRDWPKPLQLNVGMIEGGEWSGSVPEHCTVVADIGFLPSYSLEQIQERVREVCVLPPSDNAPSIDVDFHTGLRNDAYLSDAEAPLIQELLVAADVEPREAIGWNVSCDARLYAKVSGVPTAIFGSGSLTNAHSPHEHVLISELGKGIGVLAAFLSAPGFDETSAVG